jgi:phosphate transport system substrate-binding protein
MRFSTKLTFVAASALALAACENNATETVHVVGSSTVFPFSKLMAENSALSNPGMISPLIESTGSGGGFKLFCKGRDFLQIWAEADR